MPKLAQADADACPRSQPLSASPLRAPLPARAHCCQHANALRTLTRALNLSPSLPTASPPSASPLDRAQCRSRANARADVDADAERPVPGCLQPRYLLPLTDCAQCRSRANAPADADADAERSCLCRRSGRCSNSLPLPEPATGHRPLRSHRHSTQPPPFADADARTGRRWRTLPVSTHSTNSLATACRSARPRPVPQPRQRSCQR